LKESPLNCPLCEAKLPPLEALLAQTNVGTQCPRCWARLRDLKGPVLVLPKKETERPAPVHARAA